MHRHKAEPKQQTIAGWITCVDPINCAASPHRQAAHGNIVYFDRCKCGMVRESETNGGRTNYGPWVDSRETVNA